MSVRIDGASPPALDLAELKIIQQCGDDQFTRPIIVFATANLPNPKLVSYDLLLTHIKSQLDLVVESDYVIVVFYHGMVYKPSWDWLKKAYKVLDRKYKKNLKNLYIVHPQAWHKVFMKFVNLFISSKFLSKIVYIHSLNDLGKYVPLDQLYIPETVRRFDHQKSTPSPSRLSIRSQWYNGNNSNNAGNAASKQLGVPLATLMANGNLPIILTETAAHIRKEGLRVTGLFRRSPSQTTLLEVIQRYDQGLPVNLAEHDIHLSAVLLKRFIRDIPGNMIPANCVPFLHELKSEQDLVEKTTNLYNTLPFENRVVLNYLILLLLEVKQYSEENLMGVQNLSIVFGPNLIPQESMLSDLPPATTFVHILIENSESILDNSLEQFSAKRKPTDLKGKTPIEGSSQRNSELIQESGNS